MTAILSSKQELNFFCFLLRSLQDFNPLLLYPANLPTMAINNDAEAGLLARGAL